MPARTCSPKSRWVNTVADAVEIVQRVEASGKVVGIAYQRHTEPMFRYIRSEIAGDRYGRVQHTSALLQQKWRTGTLGSWRQDPAVAGGGFLHDSGSHMVDILLWVTGLTPGNRFRADRLSRKRPSTSTTH